MDKVNIGLLAYLNHMWFFQLPYVDDAIKNPEVKNKFYSLKSSHINIGRVSGGGRFLQSSWFSIFTLHGLTSGSIFDKPRCFKSFFLENTSILAIKKLNCYWTCLTQSVTCNDLIWFLLSLIPISFKRCHTKVS